MAPKPVIIYHANCLDGLAAAAVVRRREGDCRLAAWTYGRRRPGDLLARAVWIVDCVLPLADMQTIAGEASVVHWYDHHETALPVQRQLGWGVIDTGECGATLCWRELFPGEALPDWLAYVRDKDLWRWELPHAREVAAALERRMSEEHLDECWTWTIDDLRAEGAGIVAAVQAEVRRILGHGVRVGDPYGQMGRSALVLCNARHVNEVAEAAYSGAEAVDLVVQMHLRSDGRWVHSLRSKSVDCRLIAEARGGGGHREAAAYLASVPFPCSEDCLDWPC